MKIAVYSGAIPSTTFIEHLVKELAGEGNQVFLFGKVKGKVKYSKNIRVYATPRSKIILVFFVFYNLLRLAVKDFGLFKRFWQKCNPSIYGWKRFFLRAGNILPIINHQPDVFHIQWVKFLAAYDELLELLDSKIVVSFRGSHINYSPVCDPSLAEKYRKNFPNVDAYHAVSKNIAEESRKYSSLPERITVINPAVDEKLLSLKTEKKHNEVFQIISIGRFHWVKGYNFSLLAMKYLKDEGIKFKYTVIAGADPEEFLFLRKELGLEDFVEVIPGLSHKETMNKLAGSDMLLLSSVDEGIANVVLEAMALEVPVLSTSCGGMEEVITHGENGFLVPIRNPWEIAQKIKVIYSLPPEQRNLIVQNGKNTVKEKFLLKDQTRKFINFYNKVVENN